MQTRFHAKKEIINRVIRFNKKHQLLNYCKGDFIFIQNGGAGVAILK
jgi:hypothetical protein